MDKAVDALFKDIDLDGDGTVSLSEFEAAFRIPSQRVPTIVPKICPAAVPTTMDMKENEVLPAMPTRPPSFVPSTTKLVPLAQALPQMPTNQNAGSSAAMPPARSLLSADPRKSPTRSSYPHPYTSMEAGRIKTVATR